MLRNRRMTIDQSRHDAGMIGHGKHTSSEYEAELQQVVTMVGDMGRQVVGMIVMCQDALRSNDRGLAAQVIAVDRHINQFERTIDELCLSVVARRQPVATDLRLVTAVPKIVADLERMGDLSKNIGRRILDATEETHVVPAEGLAGMLRLALEMVRSVLAAFDTLDHSVAREVVLRDVALDRAYQLEVDILVARMSQDSKAVAEANKLQAIAMYIERIGDHASHIGEHIVFITSGHYSRNTSVIPVVD
jgi:phosphate transport system protein